MQDFALSDSQADDFERDGFITVDRIISDEEVALLRERYDELFKGQFETGLVPDEVNWLQGRDPADHTRQICNGWKSDRYLAGVILQESIGRACAKLGRWMGTRISQDNVLWKPPGGKPLGFHQDSSYEQWTTKPDWVSCWIALDRTTRENGCLQLVRGSHLIGRIDPAPLTPTQNEADPARMRRILARHELFYAEMQPGDALFFHCNTLHRSDANRSKDRRWTLLICYDAARNDALKREDDRSYVRLDKVADAALEQAGLKFAAGDDAEHFTSRPYVPDVAGGARKAS